MNRRRPTRSKMSPALSSSSDSKMYSASPGISDAGSILYTNLRTRGSSHDGVAAQGGRASVCAVGLTLRLRRPIVNAQPTPIEALFGRRRLGAILRCCGSGETHVGIRTNDG